MRGIVKIIAVIMTVLLLSTGCSTTKKTVADQPLDKAADSQSSETRDHLAFLDVQDPLESLNRRIYGFNTVVDNNFIEPMVRMYKKVLPAFVRSRISNFFSNLNEIPTMANCLLQAKGEKTGKVMGRFLVNSTAGVLGLFDPATDMDLIKYNEDFGQTLGHYGVPPGPYLILPLLGPSTLRDAGGTVADSMGKMFAVNALEINMATDMGLSIVDSLDFRASLPFSYGDFDSPFEYDLVRVLYLDMRELLVNDGVYLEQNKKANKSSNK